MTSEAVAAAAEEVPTCRHAAKEAADKYSTGAANVLVGGRGHDVRSAAVVGRGGGSAGRRRSAAVGQWQSATRNGLPMGCGHGWLTSHIISSGCCT